MERELKVDIKRIYKRLEELENSIGNTNENDLNTMSELRANVVRFESELTKKQRLLHQVNQDKQIRNREIEARISKLLGEGKQLEDMSAIFSQVYGEVGDEWDEVGTDSEDSLGGQDDADDSVSEAYLKGDSNEE